MLGATIGSYRVIRLLGEGGMGAVYAAEHLLLGRMAAVKVLLPEHSASSATVTRFFNEARAATAIRHLGIVEIYDFGYTPDGSAYIAMELLEGQSLAARMRAGISRASDALAIARQIAGALAAAHAKSIVHRDLKPDNIFLIADAEVAGGERIKLLDFGIAKLQQISASGAGVTNTGAVMGTPTYMAPEQCRGVSVDHRVDLYAVGCILYEMLGGVPPFSGEGAGDVLAAHIHVPPPSLRVRVPTLNVEVEALVQHLLAKDPARRVQSATALIAEIDRVSRHLGDEPRVVTRPGANRPVSAALTTLSAAVASAPVRERRRVGIWLGVAAATLAVVVAIASRGEDAPGAAAVPPVARAPVVAPEVPIGPTPVVPSADAVQVDAGAPVIDVAPTTVVTPTPVATVAVELDSEPAGADVIVDGITLGQTPFRSELPAAGERQVKLRLRGYVERTLTVDGANPIHEVVRLTRSPRRSTKSDKSVNPF